MDDATTEERKKLAFQRERKRILRQFGANLGAIRKHKGLTQQQLANEANLHLTEISYLERGLREPRLLTLLILADTLKAPLGPLANDVTTPKQRKPPPHRKLKTQS